jgi:hypothetical protein
MNLTISAPSINLSISMLFRFINFITNLKFTIFNIQMNKKFYQ